MDLVVHPLREHPPLEPTTLVFVTDGKPGGWPWSSGVGGAVFFRATEGTSRRYSWGEVIDLHIDWAHDPDFEDTLPEGWVRLVPETTTSTKETP